MKNKKGFTVVELVIVIAIIAILAAVLIPTFSFLIKKANVSRDMQLIRNLNTALASSRAENNNKLHANMTEALIAAEKFGYEVGKINKSATDNEILWDQKNDVFCYLEGDEIKYIPESVEDGSKLDKDSYMLWKIYNDNEVIPDVDDQVWSIYYNKVAPLGSIDVYVGFDAGTASVTTVNYFGDSTTGKDSVLIRTNSFSTTLIVNAPLDTVKHYDSVGAVHIIAVDSSNCYEENGIAAFTQIDSGKYKTTEKAEVELLYVSDASKVKVEVVPGTVDHAHAFDQTDAESLNGSNPGVVFDYDGNTDQNSRTDVYHHVSDGSGLASGQVTSPVMSFAKGNNSFEHNVALDDVKAVVEEAQAAELAEIQAKCIHDLDENGVCTKCGYVSARYVAQINNTKYLTLKEAIDDAVDGDTVELLCDVFCEEELGIINNITIDGKGYKASFGTDITPFDYVNYCVIKDIDIYMNKPNDDFTLVLHITGSTFDNVDIYGQGIVTGNVGAYAYRLYETNYFNNCDVYATMNGGGHASNYNSAFFGIPSGTINMNNCSFNGVLKCGSAAMLVANSCYTSVTFNLHNVKNNGLIQTTCGTNNGYFTIPNTIFGVTNDGTHTFTKIYVDDELVSLSEAVSMQYSELKGVGSFLVGPDDPTLNIILNDDKTFTITPASASNVAYYQIVIGTYVAVPGGSNRNYIFETINSGDELISKIKWADFVDYAWVALNPQAEEGSLNGNTTYTLNGIMYYLVESSTYSTQASVRELCICSVSAFKEDGTLISSISYPFD